MRRALIIGLCCGVAAIGAGAAVLVLRHRDPLVVGRELMAKGDMHQASLYLREAVRNHPANAEAAYRLGVADLAQGNAAAAELELKRARDHGYDPHALLMPLGASILQQHHYDQVLRDFVAAEQPPWALADVDALRSSAELYLGNVEKAQEDAAAAVAASPDAVEPQLASARVAIARSDIPAASAILARVLKTTPNQPDALLMRAGIAMSQGQPQTAFDDAGTVLAGNPRRTEAKLMQVRALATLGKEKDARVLVDDVLKGARHDPGANYLRMVLAIRAHDWLAANESLDVISPMIGNLPRGLFYMGLVKMESGQPAQAEEAVTKFLTTHPDDIGARKLMAFIDLGRNRAADAKAQLQDLVASGHADADTLDMMGRAQAMSGDAKGAERTLSQAQAMAPKDETILNRLAAVHLSLGETESADQELRQSLALAPGQVPAAEALIRGLLQRGDVAGARTALAGLQTALGVTETTGLLEAEVKLAGYDVPGAQATLQALLKTFPDSEKAALLMVRLDARLGQTDQAQAALAAMLRRHPADEAALELELPLLLAQGKTDRAVAVAEAAHEAAAGKPAITAALAATYLRAKDPDRAIALLDRAGGASRDPALTLLRARALVSAKRTDAALDAYRDVLEAAPGSVEVRRELAQVQAANQDIDGARATLQAGLRAAPGNAMLMQALVGLELKAGGTQAALAAAATLAADPAMQPAARTLPGDIWDAVGDHARAAGAYLAAYKAAPSTALAIHAAGAMVRAGRVQDADALLAGWLASHPDDAPALLAQSTIKTQEKQFPEAAALLEHIVTLRPGDPAALNNLAWLRGQQGNLDDALALAKRAYFAAPQPSSADTLGWIMMRSGDLSDAVPLLQQASDSGREPGQVYHYAAALAQSGQKSEARELLQKLLAGKPAFDESTDARKLLDSLGS